MHNKKVCISVRNLIEYTLRSGDINSISIGSSRMVDGIKAHSAFQKRAGKNYEKEVSISLEVESSDITILLRGRIDGVICSDDMMTIDEIKTTGRDLEDIKGDNELHWAQVKMYAYMYMINNNIDKINIRLTYIELETMRVKQFEKVALKEELHKFFTFVIEKYSIWAKSQEERKDISINSINNNDFPFDSYRKGQRELMVAVYKTIVNKNILFSRAPTGIGKTIATLFPAIKALGQKKCEKIFYLTAKTIGKEVAANTLNILEEHGIIVKRVVITAKDKICLNDSKKCNPKECIYAKGHYDRVNSVIEEMYKNHNYFNRQLIEDYSKKYEVCPYELSLDLALFCEVIVCDYNYVFDPSAVLKRFFVDNTGKYVLLIDEAHNLVDRARSIYSSTIEKNKVLQLRKKVKNIDSYLFKYLGELNKELIEVRKKCDMYDEKRYEEIDKPAEWEKNLRGIVHRIEKIFPIYKDWEYIDELLDFYFETYDYLKKAELYNEKYITYYENKGQDVIVKIFCIDPSTNIKLAIENIHGVIYFSATLLPMKYFIKILGGDENSFGLILSSPFDKNNLKLLIEKNISTKYVNREKSLIPISETISNVVKSKTGNYIVFFPSYKYMEEVHEEYISSEEASNNDVIIQDRGLTEIEKEMFIEEFYKKRETTLVAFAVLGGMFSEGIDLTGEKLSGAIIVGVGLPMICYERNLIKSYFDKIVGAGFGYAYVYPGMNKVMQASGRVIRTMIDRGIVVLVDERFNNTYYNKLFPEEWSHAYPVKTNDSIEKIIKEFWSE
jgi:DNA excision repair protein ERCC-2